METVAGRQIAGRVFGGAPVSDANTTPDASGLAEVAIQSQYRASPQDALRMASTPQGVAALKGNPALAAALEQSMRQPEAEEFYAPVATAGGKYVQFGKGGKVRESDIVAPVAAPAAVTPTTVMRNGRSVVIDARTGREIGQAPVTAGATSKDERLVSIIGADGKPIYVRESEAVGRTPFTPKTLAQETAEAATTQANAQREIDTQLALDNIGELIAHPGRKLATGKTSFMSIVPGTDAYDFNAKLDTFKAQTFIPMVSALRGMGALSDAEGKKLQAAVGALDPSMTEEAFVTELEKIASTLMSKATTAGLNVSLPPNMGKPIDLPPRRR